MLEKVFTGITPIDDMMGGFYEGRVYLLSGARHTGKTTFAFQFIEAGLSRGDACVLLCEEAIENVLIRAERAGFNFLPYVEDQTLSILEYMRQPELHPVESSALMPVEGFRQLKDHIVHYGTQRLVLDPVTPWVSLPDAARVQELGRSLVHALERLRVTTLMTTPLPASRAAFGARKALEDHVLASIQLEPVSDAAPADPYRYKMTFRKALAFTPPYPAFRYRLEPGQRLEFVPEPEGEEPVSGMLPAASDEEPAVPPRPTTTIPASAPAPPLAPGRPRMPPRRTAPPATERPAAAGTPGAGRPAARGRIRFSDYFLD